MFFVAKTREVTSPRCPFHNEGHTKTYSIDCTQSVRTEGGPRREFLCSLSGWRDCCLGDNRTRKLLLEAGKKKLLEVGGDVTDVKAMKQYMETLL